MSRKFESYTEKFPHLWKMPPNIETLTNLEPTEVQNEHLKVLDDHLWWLQKQFPNIADEIRNTREKIQIAMWLKPNISWEIMQAANNPDYKRKYRGVW